MSPRESRGGSGRGSSSPEYDEIAKAAIFDSLRQIERFTKRPVRDVEAKKHFAYLNWKLTQFFEKN